MERKKFLKAGLLALFLVAAFIGAWEWYWRSSGMPVSYNDDEALWARTRQEVYLSPGEATVFIGSSRIKFDLDIPTFEKLTGERAVQLSLVGTNPVPLLEDLAADSRFKGKLVIDVTEPLFFSLAPPASSSAVDAVEYYKKETPSQRFSARIGQTLESQFVFLEERKFALNALLSGIDLKEREGVFHFPVFPHGFEVTTAERQTYMTRDFLADTAQVNRQIQIWMSLGRLFKAPPIKGDTLHQYFDRVAVAVRKIKERGGQVVFVRTPASGGMEAGTKMMYPRGEYWDKLLKSAETKGIHYEDYPETAGFICPEMSHLAPDDAIIYTKHLVKTLRSETGWKFRKS